MSKHDTIAEEARRRHELHVGHPTHRPLSDGYELVGLRGEQHLGNEFGLQVDLTSRPGGDRGVDFKLPLVVEYPVDIKCARKPFNLIVEVGKVHRNTIYVLAGYDDATEKVIFYGWEWGSVLLKAPTKDFGYGVVNHYIPRGKLRGMDELKERLFKAG